MKRFLACVLLALPVGCDSSDSAPAPKAPPPATAPWGGGKGDVARDIPDEGAPTSVRSFAVNDAGSVYLLDDLNERIVVFEKGSAREPIALPAGSYDDVALLPDGGFALLETTTGAIRYLDASGTKTGETKLEPLGVPALRVTALEVGDAVWTVVDGSYSVKVASKDGKDVQPDAVPATLLLESGHYSLARKSSRVVTLYKSPTSGGPRESLAEVDFGAEALEWRLFASENKSEVRVLARVAKTPGEPGETILAITLGVDGSEISRKEVPGSDGVEESFRFARNAPNGKLYYMRFDEKGAHIAEVTP